MLLAGETLDDVLKALYPPLLASTNTVKTSRGETRELTGVLLEISKPRARLSRTETRGKPFSCLGELLWYFTADNSLEFIRRYIPRYVDESDDGQTVYGGYGPRLFRQRGQDQISNVVALLKRKPNTRRGVIQLFDAEDIAADHKEIPCTTTIQFLIRNGLLQAIVTMRSNDAFMGLPHDVFCFTMLQELVARAVGVELGSYKHFAGSMHFYERDFVRAEQYVSEGFQPRTEMPEMPKGEPWHAIDAILAAEGAIREGRAIDIEGLGLADYWSDLLRLLQVFFTKNDDARIDELKASMVFKKYGSYVLSRKGK